MPVGHGEKVQFDQPVFIGFLPEERQVEDVFCSPVLNPLRPYGSILSTGAPTLGWRSQDVT